MVVIYTILTIFLLNILFTYEQYCGPDKPVRVQDCLNYSDRQNICCLATYYKKGNYSATDRKQVCVQTLSNSTYMGQRSVINLNNDYEAIYDCNGGTDYDSYNETDFADSFFGVPYCASGANSNSVNDCFNATIPSMQNCCFITGSINIYKATVNYNVCLKTDLSFNNTALINNMFSSSTGGKLTCRDPANSTASLTINIGATSKYITYSLVVFISIYLIILF